MRIVAAVLALTLAGSVLAACGGSPGFGPVALSDVWHTADPNVLVIGEAEDDSAAGCGFTYRLSVRGDAERITLALLERPVAVPKGDACASSAYYLVRRVRLPLAYRGQPVIDAATGHAVTVEAPDDRLHDLRRVARIRFVPSGTFGP